MRLMVLGASKAQLNTIRRAKEAGHYVIASDYNEKTVGKDYADAKWLGSTFDVEQTYNGAVNYNIDGIMTMGTDQPVLTVAKIADRLGLPTFLSVNTALAVTNKEIMKKKFTSHKIPTVDYCLFQPNEYNEKLERLEYPVVIKPVDSQGQRGIFVVNTPSEVKDYYNDVIAYSREKVILVESYYKNDEITISGWVQNGDLTILTVTDRVTFESKEQIGICLSHEFPSKHLEKYSGEITMLSEQIVKDFGIENGPIYFQFFIGNDGVKVNEIACRIGGAYEDEFIPYLTNIDILEMTINGSLGLAQDVSKLSTYNVLENHKFLSAQLFFCNPGIISYMPTEAEIRKLPGVIGVGYNYSIGDTIKAVSNATQRVGYVIVVADSKKELEKRLEIVYNELVVLNEKDENIIVRRKIN